jgi:CBS-domain-containing membrane protein
MAKQMLRRKPENAPTAQPWNIILGQLVAGCVMLPFNYIPNWILSQWIKEAIGTACAVMAMVKVSLLLMNALDHVTFLRIN